MELLSKDVESKVKELKRKYDLDNFQALRLVSDDNYRKQVLINLQNISDKLGK